MKLISCFLHKRRTRLFFFAFQKDPTGAAFLARLRLQLVKMAAPAPAPAPALALALAL